MGCHKTSLTVSEYFELSKQNITIYFSALSTSVTVANIRVWNAQLLRRFLDEYLTTTASSVQLSYFENSRICHADGREIDLEAWNYKNGLPASIIVVPTVLQIENLALDKIKFGCFHIDATPLGLLRRPLLRISENTLAVTMFFSYVEPGIPYKVSKKRWHYPEGRTVRRTIEYIVSIDTKISQIFEEVVDASGLYIKMQELKPGGSVDGPDGCLWKVHRTFDRTCLESVASLEWKHGQVVKFAGR